MPVRPFIIGFCAMFGGALIMKVVENGAEAMTTTATLVDTMTPRLFG